MLAWRHCRVRMSVVLWLVSPGCVRCEQHHSFITAFDFTTDGEFLQSNDGGCELLFSNESCEYVAQATSLKDAEWASQSCTLGWGVKGLWPKVNDGTFFHCCDRSAEGESGACFHGDAVWNWWLVHRGQRMACRREGVSTLCLCAQPVQHP